MSNGCVTPFFALWKLLSTLEAPQSVQGAALLWRLCNAKLRHLVVK